MVYINEFLPNPNGQGSAGEFIELYNSATSAVGLNGYALSTGGKKKLSLAGYTIGPGAYLVLTKQQTGLTLKNSNGVLLLYGPDGGVSDQAQFLGVAPKNKSFARADYGTEPTQHFIFTDPTPGAANQITAPERSFHQYPVDIALSPRLSAISFFLMTAAMGITLLLVFSYIIFNNGILSDIIFGRNETTGKRTG
jgi:hypothetical protein